VLKVILAVILLASPAIHAAIPRIKIAPDRKSFTADGKPFSPRGFNYDRDYKSRLLEDYWHDEWPTVEQDFAEMKDLGANVVRVHLQFARFMDAADQPNEKNFAQLQRLVDLAEQTGLYLDLTGLACYRKQDVPQWYDDLPEPARWDAQARFWQEVARHCAKSPAIFCYDLMNEPVAADKKQPDKQWLVPHALGGFYYVQYLNLDPAGRSRDEIFRSWATCLAGGIARHDANHLITVGMLPFAPGEVARDLDILSVHIYPKNGKVADDLKLIETFAQYNKPIVIEEIFPLACDINTLEDFLTRAQAAGVDGYIGFYWGQTPDELKSSTELGAKLTLAWLELFQRLNQSRAER
jgi:hypothetical protein